MLHIYYQDYINRKNESKGRADKFWFTKNGTDFLFKYNLHDTHTDFGEVFYNKMSKLLNFDSVEVQFAECSVKKLHSYGVVVKSFKEEKNDKNFSYYDIVEYNKRRKYKRVNIFTVDSIIEHLDYFCQNKNFVFDKESARLALYKRTIFDFFVNQHDRHANNIEFILQNNKVSLAPSFDNGVCFFFDSTVEGNYNMLEELKKGEYEQEKYRHIFFLSGKNYAIVAGDYTSKIVREQFFKEIVDLCKVNPEIKAFLRKLLKTNIKQVIKGCEDDCEYVLDYVYYETADFLFKQARKDFETYLINTKNKWVLGASKFEEKSL